MANLHCQKVKRNYTLTKGFFCPINGEYLKNIHFSCLQNPASGFHVWENGFCRDVFLLI